MEPATEESRVRGLAMLARALGRSLPLPRLLEVAAEHARLAMDAASVSLSRLEPGTLDVRTIVNVGDLGPHEVRWPQQEVYTIDEFANLDLIVDRLETWTADVLDPQCHPSERALLAQLEKGCSLAAPIVVDGRLWGEFYATRHRGRVPFGEGEKCHADALVAIVAGAISRSLREEALEERASRDPLTGLLNRRGFDEQSARAFEAPAGVVHAVTLVAIDINGLKALNDTRGHVAGDRLIAAVGRALTKHFSRFPGAIVARIGGDEFCVLVSREDPQAVIDTADELCRLAWSLGNGAGISCGAATAALARDGELTPEDLFDAADRAQYVAKRARLACTVRADELSAPCEPVAP